MLVKFPLTMLAASIDPCWTTRPVLCTRNAPFESKESTMAFANRAARDAIAAHKTKARRTKAPGRASIEHTL